MSGSDIKLIGSLTSADNERMFETLEKMYPKYFSHDNNTFVMDPRTGRDPDFELLITASLKTAYIFLAKASQIDSPNNEVQYYMEKIREELKMNEHDIILKAQEFFDSVDAIDLVEECDNLLNSPRFNSDR